MGDDTGGCGCVEYRAEIAGREAERMHMNGQIERLAAELAQARAEREQAVVLGQGAITLGVERTAERDRLAAENARLRAALTPLIEAADMVGSEVYDWRRVLPQVVDAARAALEVKL